MHEMTNIPSTDYSVLKEVMGIECLRRFRLVHNTSTAEEKSMIHVRYTKEGVEAGITFILKIMYVRF